MNIPYFLTCLFSLVFSFNAFDKTQYSLLAHTPLFTLIKFQLCFVCLAWCPRSCSHPWYHKICSMHILDKWCMFDPDADKIDSFWDCVLNWIYRTVATMYRFSDKNVCLWMCWISFWFWMIKNGWNASQVGWTVQFGCRHSSIILLINMIWFSVLSSSRK